MTKKKKFKEPKQYFLCDERYGLGKDYKSSMLQLIDTAEECCNAANNGDYGLNSVVVDPDGMEIIFEWLHTGKWVPIND